MVHVKLHFFNYTNMHIYYNIEYRYINENTMEIEASKTYIPMHCIKRRLWKYTFQTGVQRIHNKNDVIGLVSK